MANREHGQERQTLQTPSPPPSDALVIFGITGDLAYKKIFPALASLERRGRLPQIVVGVARGGSGREALIARMRASLAEHGTPADAGLLLATRGQAQAGRRRLRDDATFTSLRGDARRRDPPLHYLAIPPSLFADVATARRLGCATARASSSRSPSVAISARRRR